MTRLFTFGCSMTSFIYPTWADIIGRNFKHFENWAQSAGGNEFIFNSVVECNQRNKFTADDIVIVMWTTIPRHDYYRFNEWKHETGLYLDKTNEHLHVSCADGYSILTFAYMAAVEQLLKASGCRYIPLTWTTYDIKSPAGRLYRDVVERVQPVEFTLNEQSYMYNNELNNDDYKKLYDRLAGPDWPSIEDIFDNCYTVSDAIAKEIEEFMESVDVIKRRHYEFYFKDDFVDSHPLPTEHLRVVRKYLPEFEVSSDTQTWVNDIEQKLLTGQKFKFKPSDPTRL